ncbi:MAG: hypothetical protein AB7F99_16940, partial [Vicinamibacterales bacterium]
MPTDILKHIADDDKEVILPSSSVTPTSLEQYQLVAVNTANGKAEEVDGGADQRPLGMTMQPYNSSTGIGDEKKLKVGRIIRCKGATATTEAIAMAARALRVIGSGTNDAIVQADLLKPVWATGGRTLTVVPVSGIRPIGRIISVTAVGTDGDGECELLIDTEASFKGGSTLLYAATADSAEVENTITETAFDTGSFSIPGGFLQAGDVLEIVFGGTVNDNNSTDTLTIKIKLGTKILLVTAAVDVADVDIFGGICRLMILTVGATGTAVAVNSYQDPDAAGTAPKWSLTEHSSIDFTAAL